MITPNLMVSNMASSIAFYRDIIGLEVDMMISADRKFVTAGNEGDAVFATLKWREHQLMLQTAKSLSEELSVFSPQSKPVASGTIYFRGIDPKTIANKIETSQIIKGPFKQWYGMNEIYVRDPDGYVICLAQPE